MDPWDFSDNWETDCGHAFSFGDGGPKQDGIDFCPYCGKPIEVKENADASHVQ
jgi:hypothetical protein